MKKIEDIFPKDEMILFLKENSKYFNDVNNIFVIRLGKYFGWVGGLEMECCELTFDISLLDFESFKIGFLNAINNRVYCLCSKYGTGTIDKILHIGTIDTILEYTISNNYEIKACSSCNDVYFYNPFLNKWDNECILTTLVLSSYQIKNIKTI